MRTTRLVIACLVVLGFGPGLAPAVRAQSIWLDRSVPKSIHLELSKPMFEGDVDGFFTFGNYATARFPIGSSMSLVAELPVAMLELDTFVEESDVVVGNPYLGVESQVSGDKGGWFEAGLRPPVADDNNDAILAGIASDLDRWPAFIPDNFIVRIGGHYRLVPDVGRVGADFRFAPEVWIPTGDDDADTELFSTYGAQVLFVSRSARGGAGLSGRWFMTADDASFDEETFHQFETAFDFLPGRVRPGFVFRAALDDDSFFNVDTVLGVTVNILLN